MSDFVDQVRKDNISNPLQISFSLKNWKDSFSNFDNPSDRSERLYRSGIWFSKKLEKVRNYVDRLNTSNIDQSFLLKSLCSGINRDTFIARERFNNSLEAQEEPFLYDSVSSIDIDDRFPGVSLDGYVESIIEGGELAITTVQSKGEENGQISFETINDYCFRIRNLGNYYAILVHYWKECQWNNWYVDTSGDIDIITQPKNQLSFSRAFSDHREDILASQISAFSNQVWEDFSINERLNILKSLKRVKSIKNDGSIEIESRIDEIKKAPPTWGMRHLAEEVYWTEILDADLPEYPGTNIRDLINLWDVLFSLGQYFDENLNTTSEIQNIDDLTKYCFSIKKSSLVKLIQNVLSIEYDLASNIADSLIFDKNRRAELWDRPFVDLKNNKLAIIYSALSFPNMIRYVENWMYKGGLDRSKRGVLFEDYSNTALEESFESFKYGGNNLNLIDTSKDLSFNGESEEIDLLFLIDDLIVIGEVKCQLYPSDPLEIHNTINQIKKGAKQVIRKTDFLRKYLDEFLSKYNLNKNKDYSFTNCVITNRTLGTGLSFKKVPVIDIKILTKYFESDHLPLFYNLKTGKYESSLNFYSSLTEAKNKFREYLNTPAQIMVFIPYLKRKKIRIPSLIKGENEFRISKLSVVLDR